MTEVDELRSRLTGIVWGPDGQPSGESVTTSVASVGDLGTLSGIAQLAPKVELLTVPLRFSLDSRVVLLTPAKRNPNRCSTIYHSGHGALIADGVPTIAQSLRRGCATAVIEMPQSGRNAGQVAVLDDGTRISLDDNQLHNNFEAFHRDDRPVLDLFLTPVAAVVDFLSTKRQAGPINMVGFSGGGWTTSLSAALLPRISRSMNVAGFLTVSQLSTCSGDYEQCLPQLYAQLSAEQIYVLASVGDLRAHVQVFNKHDTCCYRVSEAPAYTAAVEESVEAVGSGAYVAIVDDTLDRHGVPIAVPSLLDKWITAGQ